MSLSANYQAIDKIVRQLQTELEQAKRERDAAIKDMHWRPSRFVQRVGIAWILRAPQEHTTRTIV